MVVLVVLVVLRVLRPLAERRQDPGTRRAMTRREGPRGTDTPIAPTWIDRSIMEHTSRAARTEGAPPRLEIRRCGPGRSACSMSSALRGQRRRSSPRFRGAFPKSAAPRAHPPGLCSSSDAQNQVHDVIQTLRLPHSLAAGSALVAAGPLGAAPGTRARGPSGSRRCVLADGGAAGSAAILRSRPHWRAADPGAARPAAAMHRDCSTLLATVDVLHGAYESRSVRGRAP